MACLSILLSLLCTLLTIACRASTEAFSSVTHVNPSIARDITTTGLWSKQSMKDGSNTETPISADPSTTVGSLTESASLESLFQDSDMTDDYPSAMEQKQTWFSHQFNLASTVLFWWNLIVSPIGILGNVMCILVVSQKHNRSVSCSIYMGALAVADILMLIANLWQILLYFPLKFLPYPTFSPNCKAMNYLLFTAAHCGVMFILVMLAERVIAVTKPLQAARLLCPRRAVYIIIGICFLCLTYNVPRIPVTSSTVANKTLNQSALCTIETTNLAVGYNFASFFVTGVIPLFAISIMNAVILYGVKAAKKKIVRHTTYETSSDNTNTFTTAGTSEPESMDEKSSTHFDSANAKIQPVAAISKGSVNSQPSKDEKTDSKVTHSGQRSRDRQERQLTVMTIVMTTVFLVCTVPRYVHYLIFAAIDARATMDRFVIYVWSASTTSNLLALNSAINFYLYVMTGAKFRSDAARVLRCGKV